MLFRGITVFQLAILSYFPVFYLFMILHIFQDNETELAESEEYQAAQQVLKDTLNALEGLVN